jgi:hypothetical protein
MRALVRFLTSPQRRTQPITVVRARIPPELMPPLRPADLFIGDGFEAPRAHRCTEAEADMDAEKIVKLTPDAVRELLDSRQINVQSKLPPGKRREERWPFPGTVEVWLPDECYGECHVLATLHNLSAMGLAMRARRPIPTSTRIALALHQPELSCYGHAIVRHCTRASVGYLIGVEFEFREQEKSE